MAQTVPPVARHITSAVLLPRPDNHRLKANAFCVEKHGPQDS